MYVHVVLISNIDNYGDCEIINIEKKNLYYNIDDHVAAWMHY